MARNLRVVAESDKTAPSGRTETTPRKSSRPASAQAAANHSSRALLVKMRTMLLTQMNSSTLPAHTLPPLSRQFMELEKEIRATDIKVARENEDEDAIKAIEKASRKLLVRVRDLVLAKIDSGVPPHTLAPLSRRIMDLDKEITAMDAKATQDAEAGGTADDESWNPTEI